MFADDASSSIRVLIVDDHPFVRDGVAAMVEMQADMTVVGEAGSGAEAIEMFDRLTPDVTLMDLQMPGINGVEAIGAIRQNHPKATIVVLTTYSGDALAVRAMKAGAVALLLKNSLRRELVEVVRGAHAGRRYLPPEIASEIAMHAGDPALSSREVEILSLVASGEANKQIARRLAVSEDTVKAHLRNIFAKLEVTDRTQAVTVALRRGVIDI